MAAVHGLEGQGEGEGDEQEGDGRRVEGQLRHEATSLTVTGRVASRMEWPLTALRHGLTL